MSADEAFSLTDAIAAGLAVLAAGEIAASRLFADQEKHKLLTSLLFWEGIAMLACAAIIYVRASIFDAATIVAIIAIWMAGAAVGLLRAGIFDRSQE